MLQGLNIASARILVTTHIISLERSRKACIKEHVIRYVNCTFLTSTFLNVQYSMLAKPVEVFISSHVPDCAAYRLAVANSASNLINSRSSISFKSRPPCLPTTIDPLSALLSRMAKKQLSISTSFGLFLSHVATSSPFFPMKGDLYEETGGFVPSVASPATFFGAFE
jgi:hypothetical protein